jgi:YHS domain-containing protein
VPGRLEFSYRWKNAIWQFASAQHRNMFANNPEKFAPQYGGY